jgi:hypothetical protein
MNGPDSITDPVARRIRYTGSCPSARGSTPTRLGSCLLTCQVGPNLMTWMLTGRWHGMSTVHAGVMVTSSLSGFGTWVRSSGIRVGSAHPGEEDACAAWRASVRVASNFTGIDGVWGRFRHPISTLFSSVTSSLPPLHTGMVRTQFWQFLFLSKNQTPL